MKKEFLDYEGLKRYDTAIKEYIGKNAGAEMETITAAQIASLFAEVQDGDINTPVEDLDEPVDDEF